MELYCGLDCGGTKTLCVLADEAGRFVGVGRGGPSNYLSCSEDLARRSIEHSIENAFINGKRQPQHLKHTYVASAAVEVNGGERHIPFFSTCISTENLVVNSDAVPIWFSVARKKPAIVTLSGTGSVTYLFTENSFYKTGGWGPLLGDEGSGYDIGRKAINRATRVQDGREENDQFLRVVCHHFNIQELSAIHRLLRNGDQRSLVASLAKPICELYRQGDATAIELLQGAVSDIMLSIQSVIKKAGFQEPLPLVLSGSLLKPGEPLVELLKYSMKATKIVSEIVEAPIPAAVSAAAMALFEDNRSDAAEELIRSYGGDGL